MLCRYLVKITSCASLTVSLTTVDGDSRAVIYILSRAWGLMPLPDVVLLLRSNLGGKFGTPGLSDRKFRNAVSAFIPSSYQTFEAYDASISCSASAEAEAEVRCDEMRNPLYAVLGLGKPQPLTGLAACKLLCPVFSLRALTTTRESPLESKFSVHLALSPSLFHLHGSVFPHSLSSL